MSLRDGALSTGQAASQCNFGWSVGLTTRLTLANARGSKQAHPPPAMGSIELVLCLAARAGVIGPRRGAAAIGRAALAWAAGPTHDNFQTGAGEASQNEAETGPLFGT